MKNDLSAHRQRVKNEMIIIIKTQQELRVYNIECLVKKQRKNNDESNGFYTVRKYINEKNSWTMIMMMMMMIKIPIQQQPTIMKIRMRENELQKSNV